MAVIQYSKAHKIKEDRFLIMVFKIRKVVLQYKSNLLIGLSVLVGMILVYIVYLNSRSAKELRAAEFLGQAHILFENQNESDAVTLYNKVIQQFAGTRSAFESSFYVGVLYYEKGNFPQARQNFELSLKNKKNSLLYVAAQAYIAATYEQETKMDLAVRHYLETAKTSRFKFYRAESLLNAVRCYQSLGQYEEARKICQQVMSEFPKSDFEKRANNLLSLL